MRAECNRYRSLSYYFRLKIDRFAPIVARAAHGIQIQAQSTAAIGDEPVPMELDDPVPMELKAPGRVAFQEFPIQMELS